MFQPSEAVQLLMIINPESRSAYDSNSGIVEEKRSPLNHQIIARLMGRQRDDEHRWVSTVRTWSSLVEGDECCIGPGVELLRL